jgi:pSer/pThr/pTyr-binding forkhead associated (FHA) protein
MKTLILRALTGDLRGKEFAFSGPVDFVVGRSRTCSLRLATDSTVSRQHCVIEFNNGGAWIQDLGSRNGTLVNGTPIGPVQQNKPSEVTKLQPERHQLEDGDELRICNNIFAVNLCDESMEALARQGHQFTP